MIDLIKHTDYINLENIGRPDIFLKLECNQFGNSFKARGLINMLQNAGKVNGLVTYTTGNHGIVVAAIAKELGINAIVVVTNQMNDYKKR